MGSNTQLKPHDSIRTTAEIWNGGDGCFPDQLCARPGEVMEVLEVHENGVIVARHHGLGGCGLYIRPSEYKPAACRCDHIKRDTPCFVTPIPIAQKGKSFNLRDWSPDDDDVPKGHCTVCGHLPTCHTHTTRTAPAMG